MYLSDYFAASNSFDGFYNDFNRIFNEERVELRIIIEGGPGTGKSSLMRKVKAHYEGKMNQESVYCSSDPTSLDGLIIFGKRAVALLDGTAPHRYNVKIPGCTDIVVNLLEALDIKRLYKYKEKIVELNESKSNAYMEAYSYLSKAGVIFKAVRQSADKLFSADKEITEMKPSERKRMNNTTQKALVHSFSKNGFKLMEQCTFKELDFDYSLPICALASAYLDNTKSNFDTLLIDPLYPSGYIGGLIEDKPTTPRAISESTAEHISSRLCLGSETDLFNEYLNYARSSLQRASDKHFELEKYYKDSMNFDKFDSIFCRCIELIEF